jgi:hypothetical protein
MLHPASYLAYAAWLLPIALPFVLTLVWRDRIARKGAFMLIGALVGLGVTFISLIPILLVLVWLDKLLGLTIRGESYGGAPALVWVNAAVMLATSLVVSLVALSVLAKQLGPSGQVPKGAIREG